MIRRDSHDIKKVSKLFTCGVMDKYIENEVKVPLETEFHTEFAIVSISNICSSLMEQSVEQEGQGASVIYSLTNCC